MTFSSDRPTYAVITNDPKLLFLVHKDLFLIEDAYCGSLSGRKSRRSAHLGVLQIFTLTDSDAVTESECRKISNVSEVTYSFAYNSLARASYVPPPITSSQEDGKSGIFGKQY